jgi:hypothetical protein
MILQNFRYQLKRIHYRYCYSIKDYNRSSSSSPINIINHQIFKLNKRKKIEDVLSDKKLVYTLIILRYNNSYVYGI